MQRLVRHEAEEEDLDRYIRHHIDRLSQITYSRIDGLGHRPRPRPRAEGYVHH
jgi:hypothetical protein